MSLTMFTFSVLNVLTYLLLGLITGNAAFSGIFSIVYPLQFVVAVLISLFASASNIRANKEENKNPVDTGIILGLVVGTIIFGIVSIFVDNYIAFMNMDPAIFRNFTLMAVIELFLYFVCNLIIEKLYFENKDKQANFCTLGFIVLNLVTVVVTSLITKNQVAILLTNTLSLFVYVAVWFGLKIKKFKFDFNILKNFKYESFGIVGDLFMLIIYLFGFRIAFSFGEEYYLALSFCNLVTDPLWDAVGSIQKIAKIDISQSNYNYKNALKKSAAISVFYIAVGTAVFFTLFRSYGVILEIGIIYLAIQIADIIVNIFKQNIQVFLQLEYSATKTTLVNLFTKIARAALSIILFTPFNTDIAQISLGVVGLVILLAFRFKNFNLGSTGELVRKEKYLQENV